MNIQSADRVVQVPPKAGKEKWSAVRAQEWARQDILFGGPPAKPIDPSSRETVDWADVKKFAGKKLQIRADPDGLLITSPDGVTRYVPGDTQRGFSMAAGTNKMRSAANTESLIREFARAEIERYNKRVTKRIRDEEKRVATREFFEAGRRIREFVRANERSGITQDAVWYALENWGRGIGGYGKTQLEHATYFYDWKEKAPADDPVFTLDETCVMIIVRGARTGAGRDAILAAVLNGPYRDLSDDQLKWAAGLFKSTFPGENPHWEQLESAAAHVIAGEPLETAEQEAIRLLRTLNAKKTRRSHEEASDA